jgi:hypothetical protein
VSAKNSNNDGQSLFASRFPPRNPEANHIFEMRQQYLPEDERESDASNPHLVQKRFESRDDVERTKRTYGEKR